MPVKGKCTSTFRGKVVTGNKPAFKNHEMELVDVEKIQELSFEPLRAIVYTLENVLAFHDDRHHRKGHKYEGKIILDDYKFTVNIFAKVEPVLFQKWVDEGKATNQLKLDKKNKNMILVDEDWWLKVKEQNKNIHKKGKTGKMMTNIDRKEELKRKRVEIEKRLANNEIAKDKVWLPKEDFTEAEFQPLGKEFVPVSSYNNLKNNATKLNNTLYASADIAKQLPYKATLHFANEDHRRYQYEQTRNEIKDF